VVIGSDDGFVYCLSGKEGTLLWRFRANWWVTASPTIADLEGDGSLEVLVGDTTGTLYCLNGATGESLWCYATSQPIVAEASCADLDGDGRKEVFFGSDALYRLDCSGSLEWRFAPGEHFSATPLLLSDEEGGWVVISGDELYCLDAATGKPAWRRSLSNRGLFDASAALDKQRNLFLSLSTGNGQLLLLRSPSPSAIISLPWPKPRANLRNTGFAP
jgi:outer membrane protein assembly factor BamB